MSKTTNKIKTIKLLAIFPIGMLVLLLGACINNATQHTTKDSTVTIGQYLKQDKPVIMYDLGSSGVNKDTNVNTIYIVEKDKVTTYDISLAKKKFGDFSKMTETDIISLAKENHKNLIEKHFNDLLTNGKISLEELQSELATYEAKVAKGEVAFLNGSIDYPKSIKYYQILISALEKQTDLASYYTPKSYPLSINLETDGSGNKTASEFLKFQRADFKVSSELTDTSTVLNNFFPVKEHGIRISSVYSSTIYDKTYVILTRKSGGTIAIALENDKQTLLFDEPNTKINGITVDGK